MAELISKEEAAGRKKRAKAKKVKYISGDIKAINIVKSLQEPVPINVEPTLVVYEEEKNERDVGGVRISEESYLFILRCHAEFLKPEQIQNRLKEEYGASHPLVNSLILIKKAIGDSGARLVVANYRNAYLTRIRDVGISHKRVRLGDLEEVRGKIMEKVKGYTLETPDQVKEFALITKSLTDVVDKAREEVEGKSIVFNQLNVIGDFGDKSDGELANRRDELIRKAERVIITEANNGRTSGANGSSDGIEEEKD